MSIFQREVIQVDVVAKKLLDPSNENFLAQSVVKAVKLGTSIPAAVLRARGAGINKQIEEYYQYGTKADWVTSPGSFNFSASEELEKSKWGAVASILATKHSVPVNKIRFVKDQVEIRYPSLHSIGMQVLQDTGAHNYSITSNTVLYGGIHYELDRFIQGPNDSLITIRLKVSNENDLYGESLYSTEYETISYGNISRSSIWYQVQYQITGTDISTVTRYYNYKNNTAGAGNESTLDLAAALVLGGEYYPMAAIRINKEMVSDPANGYPAARALETTELLKTININLKDMEEALVPPASSPTDINDIDDAVLFFAVNMNSSFDIAYRYAYEQFKRYHYTIDGGSQQEWLTWNGHSDRNTLERPKNVIQISANTVRFALEWQFSTVKLYSYTGSFSTAAQINYTRNPLTLISTQFPSNVENNAVPLSGEVYRQVKIGTELETDQSGAYRTDYVVFRKKYSATQYVEVVIYGLTISYDIARLEGTYGRVIRNLNDMADGGLMFPISRDIVRLFTAADQNAIFRETLHQFIMAKKTTNLAWYATTAFQVLITIVIIAVAIYTGHFELMFTELEAAFAASVLEGIVYLGSTYVIGILITMGLEVIIEIVGAEIGIIVALLGTALALYYGRGKTSSTLFNITAQEMMFFSSQLIGATVNVIDKDLQELSNQIREETIEINNLEEDISKLMLLENYGSIGLEPYEFTNEITRTSTGSIEKYMTIATGSANIGTSVLQLCSLSTEILLDSHKHYDLPKPTILI